MAGIELVKDKAAKVPFEPPLLVGQRLSRKLLELGMINRGMVNTLCFSPPLVITEADVDEMVDKFARALSAMAGELRAEGSWRG